MMTVDTRRRITTAELLRHPWITEHSKLSDAHLTRTVAKMRVFNAKRKFRVRVGVVVGAGSGSGPGPGLGPGAPPPPASPPTLPVPAQTAAMACILGAMFGRRRVLRDMVGTELKLPADELSKVQAAFKRVASDGCVTKEQFVAVLSSLGMGSLPLNRMYKLFDKDGDGKVDYKEFLVGLSTLRGNDESTVRSACGAAGAGADCVSPPPHRSVLQHLRRGRLGLHFPG